MSNLVVRSIAGIIFSVCVAGSFILGPTVAGVLFLLFSTVGLLEVYQMARITGEFKPATIIGLSIGVLYYVMCMLYWNEVLPLKYFLLLFVAVVLFFATRLINLSQQVLANTAITTFGWLYVTVPFSLLLAVSFISGEYSYQLPLGFFLILWANDTGAYFVGKSLGKTKLYEKVSPKKTWEGLIGGALFATAIAFVIAHYFDLVSVIDWVVIAALIAIFGSLGDLFESQLKRSFQIKDSGNIIPGHGGVLDRFDGLLLSLPVVFVYLAIWVF